MHRLLVFTALTVTVLLGTTGCTTIGQPKDIDPATGKIATHSIYGAAKVNVVKSERVSLEKFKPLILTLGSTLRDQTAKLGYFTQVVDRQGMEKLLIKEGKSDLVSDVTNLLSWKKISDSYQPFLVLKLETRSEGRMAEYMQLKVIRADNADEVFVAEVKMDFMWKGVSDDTVLYPLYNAFIDWLHQNQH